MIIPVILCGGSGTRLWPVSRKSMPKQFLPLMKGNSIFQETILRLKEMESHQLMDPLIICSEEHKFIIEDQVRQLNLKTTDIILEPEPRNTAPAITVAAEHIYKKFGNAIMINFPADHNIADNKALAKSIEIGIESLEPNVLVTYGVKPTTPHIGYGYMKTELSNTDDKYLQVTEFIEKPTLSKANTLLDSGEYLWNSGISSFNTTTYLNLVENVSKDVKNFSKEAYDNAKHSMGYIYLDKDKFSKSPSISIDHLIMEKAIEQNCEIRTIPMDVGWNDLGSWSLFKDIGDQDNNGNILEGDIITQDTQNSYLYAEKNLMVTVGIKNLIVVQTSDALLVADSKKTDQLSKVVEKLKENNRKELIEHPKVTRPWGTYETLEESDNFKVKRIYVKPGAKLSVQMHKFRSEHWVIVTGEANVTNGEETTLLKENQSTYINVGTKHSIENPTNKPLEFIEVQYGSYLGEDDIIRFEDRYGRED